MRHDTHLATEVQCCGCHVGGAELDKRVAAVLVNGRLRGIRRGSTRGVSARCTTHNHNRLDTRLCAGHIGAWEADHERGVEDLSQHGLSDGARH